MRQVDKREENQNSGNGQPVTTYVHDGDVLEKVLFHVGDMGRYQKLLFVVMMLFGYTYAFVYFVQMFITATPENHWCKVPELAGLSMELRKNLSAPGAATGEWDHCRTFDANWSEVLATLSPPADGTPLVACQHGWEFELSDIPYETVTTEGENSHQLSYLYTSWIFEVLVYLGTKMDPSTELVVNRWPLEQTNPRVETTRKLTEVTNLVGGIGGVATIYTTTVWDFILCRFLVGISFNNCFMILYVLVLEYVGPKYRTVVANLTVALSYTVAGAVLPWMAFYIADWRILVWVTTAPMFIVLAAPWILPESVKWLVSRGRIDEAVKVLKRFEAINRKKIPDDVMNEFMVFCNKTNLEEKRSIFEIRKSAPLRWAMLYLILLFMGCGLVFDGLTRLSDSFGLSFFAVVSFYEIFEFLSFLLVVVILDRLGRRKSTSISSLLSSIVLLITLFVPEGISQAVLAIASRFFIGTCYTATVQWGTEVIPTPFRATGMSILHMSAFTANIMSPFIVYSRRVWSPLPMVIFTVVAFLVGGVSLMLPETKGLPLPQTRADGENIIKEHSICRKRKGAVVQRSMVNDS